LGVVIFTQRQISAAWRLLPKHLTCGGCSDILQTNKCPIWFDLMFFIYL